MGHDSRLIYQKKTGIASCIRQPCAYKTGCTVPARSRCLFDWQRGESASQRGKGTHTKTPRGNGSAGREGSTRWVRSRQSCKSLASLRRGTSLKNAFGTQRTEEAKTWHRVGLTVTFTHRMRDDKSQPLSSFLRILRFFVCNCDFLGKSSTQRFSCWWIWAQSQGGPMAHRWEFA